MPVQEEQGQIQIHTENIFPIIKKAVYSGHEVFLRELVSNGVDAISKRRMAAMGGDCSEGEEGRISIRINREANTLTISDNGIGMTADEVKRYINQVAFSSAEDFLEKYKQESDAIIGHFGTSYKGADLEYVIEESPLGTGGGLLLAVEKVSKSEPFLLLNGDTYFAVDLEALIEFSLTNNADWCFSLFRTHEEGRYMGMDISPQGFITSLKSVTAHSGRLANGGVYWIQPSALQQIKFLPGDKCSLEEDIFPTAFGLGQRMMGIEFPGPFIDIGVPIDYQRASEMLLL